MAGCPMGPLDKSWAEWLDEVGFQSEVGADGKKRNVIARVLAANKFTSVRHMRLSGPMHTWVGFERLANVPSGIEFMTKQLQVVCANVNLVWGLALSIVG